MADRKTGRPAVCEFCKIDFLSYRVGRRFCSRSCAGQATMVIAKRLGPDNPRYNGGFSISQGRTIVVTRDGGHMLYSRALMAGHVGRLLTPAEIVHHVNEDPTDDRIENLQIVTRAEHMELHRQALIEQWKFERRGDQPS